MANVNVIDHIAEPLMDGNYKGMRRSEVQAIVDKVGTHNVKFEAVPAHEVCDITGEEGPCYLCLPE